MINLPKFKVKGVDMLGRSLFWRLLLGAVLLAGLGSVASRAATPQLAAGSAHSVALHRNGTVYAWGDNNYGQLGNGRSGSGQYSGLPVRVQGLSDIVALAARGEHTLALKADGTVWAWGRNDWGELGDGTRLNRALPVQVSGLTGVVAIATGHFHSLAIRSDGTLWVWGLADSGRFGNGREGRGEWSAVPVQVPGLANVIAAAAGYAESFAITSDGRLWAWGNNEEGQLGLGSVTGIETRPVEVTSLSRFGVMRISANEWHALAQTPDGIWAWGRNNDYGQLGNGTTEPSAMPQPVLAWPSGSTPQAIALGNLHSLAQLANGKVAIWGSNGVGQLGINNPEIKFLPYPGETWFSVGGELVPIQAIAAGDSHTLLMTSDGRVHATGAGARGQLGQGDSQLDPFFRPVFVHDETDNGILNLETQPTEVPLSVQITGSGLVEDELGRIACPGVCEALFQIGTTVRLTATPGQGWEFAGWGGACTGTSTCTLTIQGPTQVIANFIRSTARYQLDAPINGSFESGISIVYGWVCEAKRVSVQVDNLTPIATSYGTVQPESASICGDTNNGFAAAINWSEYGDGQHTLKLIADDKALTSVQVRVTTLGARFLTGLRGSTRVMDFPRQGLSTPLVWSEPYQNFVVASDLFVPHQIGEQTGPNSGYWESPLEGGLESGLGTIRGWFCTAQSVSADLDGQRIDLAYGSDRPDTQGVCGDIDNGFAAAINWSLYSDGLHRITLYRDGNPIESRGFYLASPGGLGYVTGEQKRHEVKDFPYPGDTLSLQWSEPHQNFRIIGYTSQATKGYEQQVLTLYIGYFGRPPAPAGLSYYTQQMEQSQGNWGIIADDFWNSPESQVLYPPTLSVRERIDSVYLNLFGRHALPAGLDYWEGLINSGAISLPAAAYTIAYNAATQDLAVLDAKRETARLWTNSLNTPEELAAFATDAGRGMARDFLGGITTSVPATQGAVDQAIAEMVAQVGGP